MWSFGYIVGRLYSVVLSVFSPTYRSNKGEEGRKESDDRVVEKKESKVPELKKPTQIKFLYLVVGIPLIVIVYSLFDSDSKWKYYGTDDSEDSFYVDINKVRKHSGYVYFWGLIDYKKPEESTGNLSQKMFYEVNCKLFKWRVLVQKYYRTRMGKGTSHKLYEEETNWFYAAPGDEMEPLISSVCNR
jgi:hypothetical protein